MKKQRSMRMKAAKRVLLVVDAAGRIVGSAPVDAPKKGDTAFVGVGALPGQTIHEVPIPKELEPVFARPIEDLARALEGYHLRPGRVQSLLLPNRAPSSAK